MVAFRLPQGIRWWRCATSCFFAVQMVPYCASFTSTSTCSCLFSVPRIPSRVTRRPSVRRGNEEDNQADLLRELRDFSFDARSEADRMQLTWEIRDMADNCEVEADESSVRDVKDCSEQCIACRGTGLLACRYCRGTGFFMLGEDLIGTGNKCPVCTGGEEKCGTCGGIGAIAKWKDGAKPPQKRR